MAYLNQEQIAKIKSKLTTEPRFLGRLYKAKKNKFMLHLPSSSAFNKKNFN